MSSGPPSHRERDGLFRLVADSLPLLVWISGSDKRCTYFNKPWLDFTGRPLEAELGDGWADGVHVADLPQCLDTYTRAFDHREPFLMEYRLRRHDGEYRWVLDNAAPVFDPDGSFAGYIGACFDVTEFRRADAERDLANDRLRLAMESGKSVGWDWDLRTNRDTWFGDLSTIFGMPSNIHVGHVDDFRRAVHPEDRGLVWKAVQDALASRSPYAAEFRVLWPNGTVRWVAAKGQFYYSSGGDAERMLGMAVDITERKRAEEVLSSVNGRLIEAQESERARIARDLHDDIGQRLALLAVALEQLKKLQPDSSSGAISCLNALQQQTAEIIADVQALSHELHPPRLLHLGVVPAMRGFCEELSRQKNVAADFRYENVPEPVPPDVSLCLFRVLQEALHNAVRHSGVRHFDVQLRGTGDAVDLTVRDEGVGFDVDAANRGLGLGLTSMKERLKLVEGELFIESQSTRGTTVLARAPVLRRSSQI
jgi:PAS domain S-box-containing protein